MHTAKLKTGGFGKMMKQLRVNENLTLAAFATRLGISAANLCDFEQGRKVPSLKRALEFGQRLQLPEEFMIELSLESSMDRNKIPYSVSVKRIHQDPKDSTLRSNLEILVVEDNPNDVELTLRAFTKHDIKSRYIRVFRDGESVLDYLFCRGAFRKRISTQPKLVLLDLKLPTISGIEVLKQLKGNAATCTTPIVVLTASSAETTLVESYQLGVNGYIVKPINFETFSEAIGTLGKYWVHVNRTAERSKLKNEVPTKI